MMRLARKSLVRAYSTPAKIAAPPLVVITGEEFTRYAGELYLEKWIRPFVETTQWSYFDLSCKSRDQTNDQVLRDAIAAGSEVGAIYKEPTITPTAKQVKEMGLSKQWGSPNGTMRKGWNGICISRDTIHVEGMELGYKLPVLFDRHAVGGEYGAGYQVVGKGRAELHFTPAGGEPHVIDSRELKDSESAIVIYDNPYDNIQHMARHFFGRCLEKGVPPCVISKHTVFKWQEPFFQRMKEVYDAEFRDRFIELNVKMDKSGELQHFLSDVATMQLIRWSEGGFGVAALNYDGDILTDQLAQIHRSPGFLSSVLNGVRDDGTIIKEFEASHGTVTDMWNAHLRGEETSMNPLSMIEALIGAMQHAASLHPGHEKLWRFAKRLQKAVHEQMVEKGTRDLDKDGLTTEQFVDAVQGKLLRIQTEYEERKRRAMQLREKTPSRAYDEESYDEESMRKLFDSIDTDQNGTINYEEFARAMTKLGVAPKKLSRTAKSKF